MSITDIKNKWIMMQAALIGFLASSTMNIHAEEETGGTKGSGGLLDYDIETGTISGTDEVDMTSAFTNIQDKGKILVSGITGLAAIALLILFIIKAVKLGNSGENPSERSKSISSMIWLFIGIALLGGASVVTSLFWGVLKG